MYNYLSKKRAKVNDQLFCDYHGYDVACDHMNISSLVN